MKRVSCIIIGTISPNGIVELESLPQKQAEILFSRTTLCGNPTPQGNPPSSTAEQVRQYHPADGTAEPLVYLLRKLLDRPPFCGVPRD